MSPHALGEGPAGPQPSRGCGERTACAVTQPSREAPLHRQQAGMQDRERPHPEQRRQASGVDPQRKRPGDQLRGSVDHHGPPSFALEQEPGGYQPARPAACFRDQEQKQGNDRRQAPDPCVSSGQRRPAPNGSRAWQDAFGDQQRNPGCRKQEHAQRRQWTGGQRARSILHWAVSHRLAAKTNSSLERSESHVVIKNH